MNYILDYDILNEKLNALAAHSSDSPARAFDCGDCAPALCKQPSPVTRLGYEIPYYTLGSGGRHIVIVGGTHGSEIISVDFVVTLMDRMINLGEPFTDFDFSPYTFHFIPVQNPEGFIVSTSAVRTLIPRDMPMTEAERICKEYYTNYRQDDINYNNNPEDKSLKLHQKMFSGATYECIPEEHSLLRQNIKAFFEDPALPRGSMVVYRANGSGIELNRNTLVNEGIAEIQNGIMSYGPRRYNNIPKNIKGPIGLPCLDVNNFEYEPENLFLRDLLDTLSAQGLLACCLLYHGTGGEIYHEPMFEVFDDAPAPDVQREFERVNLSMATEYISHTGYRLTGKAGKLPSFDEYLRTSHPGVLLVELSKMGGNPIGPYGDISNNYIPTMESNLAAVRHLVDSL